MFIEYHACQVQNASVVQMEIRVIYYCAELKDMLKYIYLVLEVVTKKHIHNFMSVFLLCKHIGNNTIVVKIIHKVVNTEGQL